MWAFKTNSRGLLTLEEYLKDPDMDKEVEKYLLKEKIDFAQLQNELTKQLKGKELFNNYKEAAEDDAIWLLDNIKPEDIIVGGIGHADFDCISAHNVLKTAIVELYGKPFLEDRYVIEISKDIEWGYPALDKAMNIATFLVSFDETMQSKTSLAALEHKLRTDKKFKTYIFDHHENNNPLPILILHILEKKYPDRFRYRNIYFDVKYSGMGREGMSLGEAVGKGVDLPCSAEYAYLTCKDMLEARGREPNVSGEHLKDPIYSIALNAMTGMVCDRSRYDEGDTRIEIEELFPRIKEERSQSGRLSVFEQIVPTGNSAIRWAGPVAAMAAQEATLAGYIVGDPYYVIRGKTDYLDKSGSDPAQLLNYYSNLWDKNEYWIRRNLIGVSVFKRRIKGSRSLRQVKGPFTYLIVDGDERACWGRKVGELYNMQKFFANSVSWDFRYDESVLIGIGGVTKEDTLYLSFRKVGPVAKNLNLGGIAYKLAQTFWKEGAGWEEVNGGGHKDQAGCRIYLKYMNKNRSMADQLHERLRKII
jgi:hypothetical protein